MDNEFPNVKLDLTDDQLAALQPLTELLRQEKGSLVIEAFILPNDWRFKQVTAYYLDTIATDIVGKAIRAARDDYTRRQKVRERLLTVKQQLTRDGVKDINVDGDKLTFTFADYQYEVKELAP